MFHVRGKKSKIASSYRTPQKKKYLVNGHTQNQIYVIALTKENNQCKLGLDWGCQAVHCEI